MPKTLTEPAIRAAKPPASGTTTIWDGSLKNFGCRISQGGTKTFIVLLGGGHRKAIGRYPVLSLADARAEAKKLLAQKTLEQIRPGGTRFRDALGTYLAGLADRTRPATQKETRRLLEKHFARSLGSKKLAEITANDIAKVLDQLVRANKPGEANHAFSAMKTFLRWATSRSLIAHSPIEAMRPPTRTKARERVLSDSELKLVWNAANEWPFGTIVRLLILLGARRGEVAALRWLWINTAERTITFPREIMKMARTHTVPYGPMTAALLEDVPRFDDVLFPARGSTDIPFSGFSKGKERLDRMIQRDDAVSPIAQWTLHDLRRTVATNLAGLDVRVEVTEAMLGHRSGKLSGIVSVYQRHSWLPQMREAMAAWERRLAKILA